MNRRGFLGRLVAAALAVVGGCLGARPRRGYVVLGTEEVKITGLSCLAYWTAERAWVGEQGMSVYERSGKVIVHPGADVCAVLAKVVPRPRAGCRRVMARYAVDVFGREVEWTARDEMVKGV